MKRIIFPINSFTAFVDYNEADNTLFVTLRKGARYLYRKVTGAEFKALNDANNKGSHLAIHIFKNKEFAEVECVPLSIVEQITLPKTKFYQNLVR